MRKKKTSRGFEYIEFKDNKGVECSIQQSSNAMQECIWFGADKIDLQEFVAFRQPHAWVAMPQFDVHTMEHHYVGNNRMELSRKQVAKLLPILQKFVETGQL